MNNNTTTTTTKKATALGTHKAADGSPSSKKATVVSKGQDHDDADLLLAIAKARAKEGSISATTIATTATTRAIHETDDGKTTMRQQENKIAVHAESNLPHKNCTSTSTSTKKQETDPMINGATEEKFDILDVVRERQQTTVSPEIFCEKEIEKQKKNASEIITSKSKSNTNPTSNDSESGAERLNTNKKKTNTVQQNHVAEEFDVMDAVLKRAALMTNEESNDVEAVPEPPQQSSEGKRAGNSIASQPGAYSGAPGEGLQRRDTFRFSLVGVLGALGWSRAVLEDRSAAEEDIGIAERTNHNEPILTNTDQTAGLAQATPVDDDDFIAPDMEAQPFDVDEAEKKKSTVERTYRAKLGAMAILITAAVATVLGFVLKNKRKEEYHSALAPSVAPSDAPSETPSSAPTGSLNSMMANLPKDTIEKLGNSSTPQWKAWDWLLNHPNITGLEEWRKTQLFALATFYYSFGGEEWNEVIQERWMDYEKEECLWFSSGLGFFNEDGVYVDQFASFLSDPCNDDGEFISLHVENLQLSGLVPTMPPEIALLTSLSVLSLGLNDINASFSDMMIPELLQLANITQLSFSNNDLTGTIPTELGLMSGMDLLGLYRNTLTGTIPTELALLSNMTTLILSDNQLTGPVPTEIGLLTDMEYIYLWANTLTGSIPTEVGRMTNMITLDLYRNQLTGAIPTVLGLMTNLGQLVAFSNALDGPVPSELGLLTSLKILSLTRNSLTGTIHNSIWSLKNMTRFYLHTNNLSGSISTEVGLMTNLLDLSLQSNSFSALIPSDVGLLTNLQKVWVFIIKDQRRNRILQRVYYGVINNNNILDIIIIIYSFLLFGC